MCLLFDTFYSEFMYPLIFLDIYYSKLIDPLENISTELSTAAKNSKTYQKWIFFDLMHVLWCKMSNWIWKIQGKFLWSRVLQILKTIDFISEVPRFWSYWSQPSYVNHCMALHLPSHHPVHQLTHLFANHLPISTSFSLPTKLCFWFSPDHHISLLPLIIHTCLPTCLLASYHICLPTYLPTCITACRLPSHMPMHLQSKVVFHQRLSSIKGCLP